MWNITIHCPWLTYSWSLQLFCDNLKLILLWFNLLFIMPKRYGKAYEESQLTRPRTWQLDLSTFYSSIWKYAVYCLLGTISSAPVVTMSDFRDQARDFYPHQKPEKWIHYLNEWLQVNIVRDRSPMAAGKRCRDEDAQTGSSFLWEKQFVFMI